MAAPVPKEVVKEFARRLYRLMTEQNLSQSDLARKIWGETTDPRGFKVAKNRDRISQYLNARSLPDTENTRLIANALDVTPQDLIPQRTSPVVEEHPEVSMVAVAGAPGQVRLMVDKVMPFADAAHIISRMSGVKE